MNEREALIQSLGTITLEAGWINTCGDLGDLLDGLLKAGWQPPEPDPCAHTSQSRVGDTSQWICNQCGDVDERGGAYA